MKYALLLYCYGMRGFMGIFEMIISEKQIFSLIAVVNHYIELISLINMEGIDMNAPDFHQDQAINLLRAINNQQPTELKAVE